MRIAYCLLLSCSLSFPGPGSVTGGSFGTAALADVAGRSESSRQTQRGDADRPPNVVMIISDDQTYSDLGFMGNREIRTPHLDRLAEQSARFVNGYVPSSVCRPSLVTLLTGLYPHQHGVHFNHPPPGFAALTRSDEIDKQTYDALRERGAKRVTELPTLPRILAERGYRSLQTGKYWEGHWENAGFTEGMTLGEPRPGAEYGNITLPNGDLVAHGNGDHGLAIGRETMDPIRDFLDRHGEEPFFIWYAPFLPHLPHNSPPEYFRIYEDSGLPEHLIPYYAACTQFDDTVGELVRMIERRGLAGRTLFVFVIDNGFTPDPEKPRLDGAEFNYTKTSKRSPFEDGLRTPILLRWDGQVVPDTHEPLCSSVDLFPTILAAAGIDDIPENLPGRSLWPAARGEAELPDRPVFGEIYPGDARKLGNPAGDIAYRWVRKGRFKLIVPHRHGWPRPWGRYLDEPALFDVVADPRETTNLADREEFSNQRERLQELLDDWWNPDRAKR
jgi:arylsulfatase A